MAEQLTQDWTLLLFAAIVLAVLLLARLLLRDEMQPYQKRASLLSDSEMSFFRALQEAVNGEWAIQGMVRLADLIEVRADAPHFHSWTNRIHTSHVHFVLFHRETMEPKLAIAVNEPGETSAEQRRRDRNVGNALSAAGLPLLRIRLSESYEPEELCKSIRKRIDSGAKGER